MNPLLVYLKPKDGLFEVDEAINDIPCDKLRLCYFPYPQVYRIAYDFIASKPEYTHIIWIQNDIVFTKNDYFDLCRAAGSYPIIGISMNVDDSPEGSQLCAFTEKPFYFDEVNGFIKTRIPYSKRKKGIIKVFHNGGPFISTRKFYLEHPLKGFGKHGYNADLAHGCELHQSGYIYYLNADIHVKHLRYQGDMMVGRKKPILNYERY